LIRKDLKTMLYIKQEVLFRRTEDLYKVVDIYNLEDRKKDRLSK